MEKSPLRSKKFVAFLVAELAWKLVLVVGLVTLRSELSEAGWGWGFLLAVVVVSGFVEIGYLGGQAWLDRYVRVAALASGIEQREGNDAPATR